jgi:hypothetical protein
MHLLLSEDLFFKPAGAEEWRENRYERTLTVEEGGVQPPVAVHFNQSNIICGL